MTTLISAAISCAFSSATEDLNVDRLAIDLGIKRISTTDDDPLPLHTRELILLQHTTQVLRHVQQLLRRITGHGLYYRLPLM